MTTDVSTRPGATSEGLVEHAIEVPAESPAIEVSCRSSHRCYLRARDKGTAVPAQRGQLCDLLTVAGHYERLPGDHGVDHLGVAVAQLSLRDHLRHDRECSRLVYAMLRRSQR